MVMYIKPKPSISIDKWLPNEFGYRATSLPMNTIVGEHGTPVGDGHGSGSSQPAKTCSIAILSCMSRVRFDVMTL
jgi:hypothetical protein